MSKPKDTGGPTYGRYSTARADATGDYLWPHVLPALGSLPKGASILDAGCGNGHFARVLCESGFKVHGIDSETSGVEAAAINCPQGSFSTASVYDDLTGLPNAPFDAIVSLEVVEHLYRPKIFMQRAFESIRAGGILVLSTPYHGYAKNLALAAAGKMDWHHTALWEGGHIKFWSKRTLTTLAEREGFIFRSFSGAGRLPFFWKSMVLTFGRPAD